MLPPAVPCCVDGHQPWGLRCPLWRPSLLTSTGPFRSRVRGAGPEPPPGSPAALPAWLGSASTATPSVASGLCSSLLRSRQLANVFGRLPSTLALSSGHWGGVAGQVSVA